MAWLDAHAQFNPDHYPAPVIGIAATLGDHDSGRHRHARGQLLFTRQVARASPLRSSFACCHLPVPRGFPRESNTAP